MEIFRIGSRESRLAVVQSELAAEYLRGQGIETEIVTMKTTGDIILNQPLEKVGGKGLFVKELDLALLEGRSDLSVHSLKDVPIDVDERLPLIGFSAREDARDVLVLPEGITELNPEKPIGCSSRRRVLQAKKLYPQMQFANIRGNVITRLRKLDEGQYSALILAAAGLKRLGLEHRISRYFDAAQIIPCAGQGILALQGIRGKEYTVLEGFFDEKASVEARCERAFIRKSGGDCTAPVAAHAVLKDTQLVLHGMYAAKDMEKDYVSGMLAGGKEQPEQLGEKLAEQLMEAYRQS